MPVSFAWFASLARVARLGIHFESPSYRRGNRPLLRRILAVPESRYGRLEAGERSSFLEPSTPGGRGRRRTVPKLGPFASSECAFCAVSPSLPRQSLPSVAQRGCAMNDR